MSDKTSTLIMLYYSFILLATPSHLSISPINSSPVFYYRGFSNFSPQGDCIFSPSFPSAAFADCGADSTL